MYKKPILHLFDNRTDLNYHMLQVGLTYELDPELEISYRDMEITTSFNIHAFREYKGYEEAKGNELFRQWGCVIIYFKDLPENVVKHYLSRIRWVPR